MTIANVTATTPITAVWGNSVADELNGDVATAITNASTAQTRLNRGVYALGTIFSPSDATSSFVSGSDARVTTNELTLSRPAWATGKGLLQVTVNMDLLTDANVARVYTHLAYQVDAAGAWAFVSSTLGGQVTIPASTFHKIQSTMVVEIPAGEFWRIAPAGRQVSGSGSVEIQRTTLNGTMMWVV